MRNWAGKCGYVLSEKALCPTIRKDRARTSGGKEKWIDNKIWVGEALPIVAEEDVFEALGLKYLAPRERTGQVEHALLRDWKPGFVADVFAKRLLRMEDLARRFREARVDGRRLLALDESSLAREFGVTDAEARRNVLAERDRAAAEEPTRAEAEAGGEEFERRWAAWKGRLRNFWRLNDGR